MNPLMVATLPSSLATDAASDRQTGLPHPAGRVRSWAVAEPLMLGRAMTRN